MKIISANVNGIRSAANKGFFDWLATEQADVVCLQEIKIQEAQMTPEFLHPLNMHGYFHYAQKPGYSGVAIYTKHPSANTIIGFDQGEFDAEGRMVHIDLPEVTVISAYFPSGSSSEERQIAKFRFLHSFLPYFNTLQAQCQAQGRGLLLCGDINIAHSEIDLKNWKGNLKNSGFTPEERAWISDFLTTHQMVDIWRTLYPSEPGYTWWSNRGQAYSNDVGWRIDYHLANTIWAKRASNARIYKGQKFSDHAPLIVEYTL